MTIEIFTVFELIISVFFSIEFLVYMIVRSVNKKFQWLIIQKDEKPELSKSGLEKFISHGYDHEFGWVRKPNTSHNEIGKDGITKWTINSNGERSNSDFETLTSKISCYGDSFTFCRQVNDDETWEHFLSEFQCTNVKNFGVGNYGLDQVLLRLKREYPKNRTGVVIIAVVPDTISRIASIWKHYYEYGNTFGFKPRFILKDDKLYLIKNPIDNKEKFFNYYKYLDEIKKYDFFYNAKFKKEKIYFPYSLIILRNFKRNFLIIYWIVIIQIYKKLGKNTTKIEWEPMKIIMRINLKWRIKLYNDQKITTLLKKIIEEFVNYSKQNNFKPVFVFLPQKDDILFIKTHHHFYEEFVKELGMLKDLLVIDITKDLLNETTLDQLYSDSNEYGGHYSREGNKKIAYILNRELENLL